jgi:ankyrin repeat protein
VRCVLLAGIAILCSCRCAEWPLVIAAARNGDVRALEALLNAGADPNSRAGVNDWTALLHAIHKHQEGAIRVLLAHGADVNAAGRGGTTPLMMASGYGYAGLVRVLLDAGADPSRTDAHGATALVAAVAGAPDIDRFTLGRCQTDTVRALVEAAPDIRLRGLSGGAAFRIAELAGCRDVIDMVKPRR